MTISTRAARRSRTLAVLMSLLLAGSVVAVDAAPPTAVAADGGFAPLAPPEGCVDGSQPDPQKGLEPNQIATAYGIAPLWQAGYRGQGIRMALIEPGQTYDPDKYEAFVDCWGAPEHPPIQVLVGTNIVPPPQAEATFDVQVAVGLAPRLDGLYVLSSASGSGDEYAALIDAALDWSRTGGDLVDVISMSFDTCESEWHGSPEADERFARTEAAFERAARLGVKVFVAAGDSGSTGCAAHPVHAGDPGAGELALLYPQSSPWVTSVGGTQLELDGTIETGGTITVQRVWHQPTDDDTAFYAGGGGVSAFVPLPEYQRTYGLSGARIHKPDVTALAGPPRFPGGGIGTSGATPLTASGVAVVDSYLLGHGVAPPGYLNPLLYEVAASPAGARVFSDVTVGDNDLFDLGCCEAGPRYDEASGLGSIRFDALAAYLVAQASGATTTTGASGPPLSVVATPAFTG